MNVTFLLRRDARAKPGGDTSKVERYVEHLTGIGVRSSITTDRKELQHLRPDVVHIVNLDLPAENLANARAASAYGARLVLSTIRHPYEGVKSFYTHGDDRLYRRLRKFGISASRGVGLRELIKLGMTRDSAAMVAARDYVELQGALLSSVDYVLPMAQGELDSLRSDFTFEAPARVVANALSFEPSSPGESERTSDYRYDAISIGRIEPRKNSLALARIAARSPRRVMAFAGQLNQRHPQFVREFLRVVHDSPNIHYLGSLPHAQVRTVLAQSGAYLNPAWFEVVAQADFEAGTLGPPILPTQNG